MKKSRILLADDHTLFVEALQKVLEPEFDLVASVADGRALLDAAPRLNPDVILLDLSMPLLNGIDAARQLCRLVPETKLVFLSMHGDPTYVTEAFRAGAWSPTPPSRPESCFRMTSLRVWYGPQGGLLDQ